MRRLRARGPGSDSRSVAWCPSAPALSRGLGPPRCCHQSRPPVSSASAVSPPALESLRDHHAHDTQARRARDRPGHPVTPQRLLLEVPLHRAPSRPSTPTSRSEERSLRPVRAIEQVSFRPRGLSPPRRFPPDSRCRRCCSLLPIMGFITFLLRYRLHEPPPRGQATSTAPRVPAMRTPLEELPADSDDCAHHLHPESPVSRTASAPLPLFVVATLAGSDSLHRRHHVRRLPHLSLDFEASFRRQVFRRPSAVASDRTALSSHGLLLPL